ncbi:hypothetical protein CPB84DRAFT_1646025, partial [Gymnopilus junonius]
PQARYAFAENVLGFQQLQPFVHNCLVTIKEGRHFYKFMVFFKWHHLLPPNPCLQNLMMGVPVLRSDVVVMSVGINAAHVNM